MSDSLKYQSQPEILPQLLTPLPTKQRSDDRDLPVANEQADAEVQPQSLLDNLDASADSFRDALIKSFTVFERDFHQKYPLAWWTALLGPFLLTAAILALIWTLSGWNATQQFVVSGLTTFFLFGRFAIAGAGALPGIQLTPTQAFWMLTYMDIMIAMFVTFHMGMLFRLPYVGAKIGALVYDGKFVLDRYRWMKRIAFVGLVLFVVFPTSTTGSIGGSIFGRLLGLGRAWTLLGIACGSCLGNLLMLWIGESIQSYIDPNNIWTKVVSLAIVLVVIVLIESRYRQLKKRYLAAKESD